MTQRTGGRAAPDTGSTRAWAVVGVTTVWHVLLAFYLADASLDILRMPSLVIAGKPADLGRPVQVFAALVVLLPAVLALVSSVLMGLRSNLGRYLALAVNLGGGVMALFLLLGSWGFYGSFERIVDAVMARAPLTLGLALAYALYLAASRLDEQRRGRLVLGRIALGLAGVTLILILAPTLFRGLRFALGAYASAQTWALTVTVIVFGVLLWQLLGLAAFFGERPEGRTAWQGWFMLAPNIIGFLFFFAGPLLLSFYLSFTNSSVGRVPQVTGFDNYARLLALEVKLLDDPAALAQNELSFGYAVVREVRFGDRRLVIGARDRLFWISLGNTLLFGALLIPLAILPALGMALILNSSLPGVRFFRALYFLPSVAAVVGTALIWRWLYTPTTGFVNYAITALTNRVGLHDPEIQWLSDPNVVLISIVLLAAWQVVGYNTVLFLAGLQGIPRMLFEAAKIDGANPTQRFRHITLPQLGPTTFFVLITTMVTALQVFNEPYALFPARPVPEGATTLVYYLYTQGFNQFNFGYASAIAWVLFVIIFGFTFLQFRLNRTQTP